MKKGAAVLAMLATFVALSALPAFAEGKELTASLGGSFGGFIPSFTTGLAWTFPLQAILRGEFDLFYYMNPLERSKTPGLAITSTGVGTNFSYLFSVRLKNPRILPYACLSLGLMYVSETWEYDLISIESFGSMQMDIGLGAGVDYYLGKNFGFRVDGRFLFLFQENKPVPRFTAGFIRRF